LNSERGGRFLPLLLNLKGMKKFPNDLYDFLLMPKEKQQYIVLYGRHFNKKMYECAAKMMRREKNGKIEKVPVYTKEEVDELLKKYGVEVENKGGYDYVYVAQMCKADLYGSSIPDEQHLAMYVKDVCDDADLAEGTIMRKWYASMVAMGERVGWEELLGDD
jgi:hypothetical protein